MSSSLILRVKPLLMINSYCFLYIFRGLSAFLDLIFCLHRVISGLFSAIYPTFSKGLIMIINIKHNIGVSPRSRLPFVYIFCHLKTAYIFSAFQLPTRLIQSNLSLLPQFDPCQLPTEP